MKAIGIDWGTSNLRAFLYADDELIAEQHLPFGIRQLPKGGFPEAFAAITAAFPADVPVLLYGMVGANTGWREAPYVSCPVSLSEYASQLVDVSELIGRRAWLAPGVRCEQAPCIELMRGEEVQIWGTLSLYPDAQTLLLPGTHSKSAQIQDGRLKNFRTAFTGELFAVLRQHSILSASCAQVDSQAAWEQGVLHSMLPDRDILRLLFQARSQVLGGHIQPEHSEAYLSGLLIGSELGGENLEGLIYVVAAPELAKRYQQAAMILSADCQIICVPPVLAGHMGLRAIQECL